jgi:DNA-binding NarL/FixJ family response regulator
MDMKEAYKLGVNSYVLKPVVFDEFVKAMSHLGLYWLLINKPLV